MVAQVEAKYIGYNENCGYRVNVRTANPTGNLGDAGVIRCFATKEDAKAYAKEVNETGVDTFVHYNPSENNNVRHQGDVFVHSHKSANDGKVSEEPPEISWSRAVSGFLTKEQIDKINETRRLPDNVKIVPNRMGGYRLTYNYVGFTAGTQTVPEGFEMKQDIIGQVHVVPKDTKGALYK